MADPFAPCSLLEHEPGSYSLMFMDMEQLADRVKSQGGNGGGYSWEAMVKAVLEIRSINLPDVEFDPESDMFSAASSDKNSLRTIASIIRELTRDPALMNTAISHAKSRGYFS